MTPIVVAVVLTWRDTALTRDCVRSLLRADEITRIIVVDNESSGHLRDLEQASVELIEEPRNLGFSRGVNTGIRRALALGADYVFVINNDATIETDCVRRMLEAHRHAPLAGILGPVVYDLDGTLQSTGGHLHRMTARTSDLGSGHRLDYITWAAVLLPRATLESVGLLDEDFFLYWEDVDYGLRLRDSGLDLIIVPDAAVMHRRSSSHANAGSAVDRHGARGLVLLARKRKDAVLKVGAAVRICSRLAKRLARGDREAATAILAGVRDARGVRR